jgi:hypothetical protein
MLFPVISRSTQRETTKSLHPAISVIDHTFVIIHIFSIAYKPLLRIDPPASAVCLKLHTRADSLFRAAIYRHVRRKNSSLRDQHTRITRDELQTQGIGLIGHKTSVTATPDSTAKEGYRCSYGESSYASAIAYDYKLPRRYTTF